jgi:ABC-type Mn2+/Zn2+ transport system ATPase subunit
MADLTRDLMMKFALKEKEIVTVLGANGAGKSTLLMTISGILPSREGGLLSTEKRSLRKARAISFAPESLRFRRAARSSNPFLSD